MIGKFLHDSLIVGDFYDRVAVRDMIGIDNGNLTTQIIYNATKDGWTMDDFHRHVDNHSPTLIII